MPFIPDRSEISTDGFRPTPGFTPDIPVASSDQKKKKSIFGSIGGAITDITGLSGIHTGAGQAAAFLTGSPQPEKRVTPKQFAGSIAKLGLTELSSLTPGVASTIPGLLGLAARAVEFGATGAGFQAAENIEKGKKITEGLGTAAITGAAVPPVLGAVGRATKAFTNTLTRGLPQRLISSEIKPLLKDLSYGKNPAAGVLKEGIVASNLDDLGRQLSEKVKIRGEEIGKFYKLPENSSKIANFSDVLSPIDDAITLAKKSPRSNRASIARLEDVRKDLLRFSDVADETGRVVGEQPGRDISALNPEAGFDLKRDVSELTKFTGNRSDDELVNKALKKTYGLIDSKLDSMVPGLKEANEHWANLKSAQVATEYRDLINQRQNLISLGTKVGIGGGVIYELLNGDYEGAAKIAGVGVLGKALGSTRAKTEFARALSSLEPSQRIRLLTEFIGSLPISKRIFGSTSEKQAQKLSPQRLLGK